jgi:adenylate kinase
MEDQALADKIRRLDDLELALLSCLIADQHCLIETSWGYQASLADELKRVSSSYHHPALCKAI